VLLLWFGPFSPMIAGMVTILLLVAWAVLTATLLRRMFHPLRSIASRLAALRQGDYSSQARRADPDDALGEVLIEVNTLGTTLREQRLGALEATHLLRRVMAETDVALFTFDQERVLRLVNGGGERLMAQPAERLLGRSAASLGLEEALDHPEMVRTFEAAFPGKLGRWEVRRSSFRQGGRPHHLLVISDLSRALREEERQAWKSLIRVLSHEINNSLAPIHSIADSLREHACRDEKWEEWTEDLEEGLSVISSRAEALTRFMASYARLARLPEPDLSSLEVGAWIQRVAALETRKRVEVRPGPELTIQADGDQLDQLLINLVDNAVEATMESGGQVSVAWGVAGPFLEVRVEDDGPGITDMANLFVPFFTTKPSGSGIGLVLSRQISEAHGGSLTLENRKGSPGCFALLRLPMLQG
jgi:nitrogen fixation/metabolism regulation signal transduction histidine kinase